MTSARVSSPSQTRKMLRFSEELRSASKERVYSQSVSATHWTRSSLSADKRIRDPAEGEQIEVDAAWDVSRQPLIGVGLPERPGAGESLCLH